MGIRRPPPRSLEPCWEMPRVTLAATPRPVRIAVDIGGTFTDLQILDARHGIARAWKTPTTPVFS